MQQEGLHTVQHRKEMSHSQRMSAVRRLSRESLAIPFLQTTLVTGLRQGHMFSDAIFFEAWCKKKKKKS
jgi:hypothetical protein